MLKFFTPIILFFFILTGNLTLSSAQDFSIGQSVILKAKKQKGVPLHREPKPSYLQHIPDGTVGTIKSTAQNGHWLSIQLPSGEVHWVHKKYVQTKTPIRTPISPNNPSTPKIPSISKTIIGGEEEVWTNKEHCQAALESGLRMAEGSSEQLRVATWNLRWFPIGSAPDQFQASAEPTDLDWLICAIRWMQVDVLAIQETLATPEAKQAWKTLAHTLFAQTGDTWRFHQQTCGRPEGHHIGLLWNDSSVTLSKFDSLWQLNAKAKSARKPCSSGLRPGHYAFVQSREKEGADFHLIAVHLKSGPTVFAVEQRQKALNGIDKAVAPLLKRDQDVIILGDFNTMGAGDQHSQKSELKYLRRFVAKEKPGFSDLPMQPQCSHYFRGHGGQLDHILVTKGMEEISVQAVQVTGYCALAGCRRIRGDYPLAYRRLSDHCPVVLEVGNRDAD